VFQEYPDSQWPMFGKGGFNEIFSLQKSLFKQRRVHPVRSVPLEIEKVFSDRKE
jgi:hypothetical protein